jgi:hypothetical protein
LQKAFDAYKAKAEADSNARADRLDQRLTDLQDANWRAEKSKRDLTELTAQYAEQAKLLDEACIEVEEQKDELKGAKNFQNMAQTSLDLQRKEKALRQKAETEATRLRTEGARLEAEIARFQEEQASKLLLSPRFD